MTVLTTGAASPLGLPFSGFTNVAMMADGRVAFLGSSAGTFRRTDAGVVDVVVGRRYARRRQPGGGGEPAGARAGRLRRGARLPDRWREPHPAALRRRRRHGGRDRPAGSGWRDLCRVHRRRRLWRPGSDRLHRDPRRREHRPLPAGGQRRDHRSRAPAASPSAGLVFTALRLLGVTADGRVGYRASVASAPDGLFVSGRRRRRVVQVGEASPVGGTFRTVTGASMSDGGTFTFRGGRERRQCRRVPRVLDGCGADRDGRARRRRRRRRHHDQVAPVLDSSRASTRRAPSPSAPRSPARAAARHLRGHAGEHAAADRRARASSRTPAASSSACAIRRSPTTAASSCPRRRPAAGRRSSSIGRARSPRSPRSVRPPTSTRASSASGSATPNVRDAAERAVFAGSRGRPLRRRFRDGGARDGGVRRRSHAARRHVRGLRSARCRCRGHRRLRRGHRGQRHREPWSDREGLAWRAGGGAGVGACRGRQQAGRLLRELPRRAHPGRRRSEGRDRVRGDAAGGRRRAALLYTRGGKPQLVVRANKAAPGGGTFDTFGTPAVLRGKRMAFVAQVGPDANKKLKMFLDLGSRMRVLAAQGGGAPGRLAGRFDAVRSPRRERLARRLPRDARPGQPRGPLPRVAARAVGLLVGSRDAAPGGGTFRAFSALSLGGSQAVFPARLVGSPASAALYRVSAAAVPAADATAPAVQRLGAPGDAVAGRRHDRSSSPPFDVEPQRRAGGGRRPGRGERALRARPGRRRQHGRSLTGSPATSKTLRLSNT